MNKISVITTVYNGEKTIEDTILSVLNQSFENFEYLIIDAKSSDNSLCIIKKYEALDSRVRCISEKDKGIYDGYNKGIANTDGNIVVVINADDFLAKDVFSFLDIFFTTNKSIGLLACSLAKINERIQAYFEYNRLNMRKMSVDNQVVHTPAVFYKREVFEKIGNFNLNYKISSDYDFFNRCVKAGVNIYYSSEITTIMRVGGVSDDIKFEFKKTKEQITIGLSHLKGLSKKIKFVYKILKKALKKYIFNLFYNEKKRKKRNQISFIKKINFNSIFWFK
jgi:glycosyltransferase involved in cell wall biosynthesis